MKSYSIPKYQEDISQCSRPDFFERLTPEQMKTLKDFSFLFHLANLLLKERTSLTQLNKEYLEAIKLTLDKDSMIKQMVKWVHGKEMHYKEEIVGDLKFIATSSLSSSWASNWATLKKEYISFSDVETEYGIHLKEDKKGFYFSFLTGQEDESLNLVFTKEFSVLTLKLESSGDSIKHIYSGIGNIEVSLDLQDFAFDDDKLSLDDLSDFINTNKFIVLETIDTYLQSHQRIRKMFTTELNF